MPYFKTIPTRW